MDAFYCMTIILEKNKCELITHNCTQLCIDTAESFKCACRDGFVLQADGKTCLPGDGNVCDLFQNINEPVVEITIII